MCKSGVSPYNYCVFQSTVACGKLVENTCRLRITYLRPVFPLLSTGLIGVLLRKSGKLYLKYLKINNLTFL